MSLSIRVSSLITLVDCITQTEEPLYGADINGSLNIGRKVVGEVAFSKNPIERLVVSPVRVKAYKADSKYDVCVQN